MSNGDSGQQAKSATVISEDVKIVGTIECAEAIQFNGDLEGDLNCAGDAVIGQKATIKGNLSVSSVSIMGQVEGNVAAKDRIELKASARVNGDIKAKRLTVVDGVTFIGRSEINPSGAAPVQAAQPAPQGEANKGQGQGQGDGKGGMHRK